jgi:hypothetical protein
MLAVVPRSAPLDGSSAAFDRTAAGPAVAAGARERLG